MRKKLANWLRMLADQLDKPLIKNVTVYPPRGGVAHVFMVDRDAITASYNDFKFESERMAWIEHLKRTEQYEELARMKREGKL